MPRLKNYGPGRRVNIWIPERYLKNWESIENNSKFVQLCMDDVVGIMTWAILKSREPEKYVRPVDSVPFVDVVDGFNDAYPLPPLAKNRINKNKEDIECKTPSPNQPELW